MQTSLAPKYYLTHALELFSYVSEQCSHLLSDSHRDYLNTFGTLDEDAQCLLVRLLGRKHAYIKRSSLNYPEISNLALAEESLLIAGFIDKPNHEDWRALAPLMTKPELLHSLASAGQTVKTSLRKEDILAIALGRLSHQTLPLGDTQSGYLAKRQQDTADYLFFLFFGDLRNRFQKFAMRDLGVLNVRKSEARPIARFEKKEYALTTFELLKYQRDFKADPQRTFEAAATYTLNSSPNCNGAQEAKDKLLLALGEHALTNGTDSEATASAIERALTLWQASKAPKATERWVRHAYSFYGKEALQERLAALRADEGLPSASRVFIEDFYARKYQGKRTSIYTDMLRATHRKVLIDEAFLNDVEQGVIAQYQQLGAQVIFTENKLWRALFAFTFWPLLYAQRQHNEFDKLPAPLKDLNFYQNNQQDIELLLSQLGDRGKTITLFTKMATQHYGYPTGLFRWRPSLMDMLIPCLVHSPKHAIENTLRRMAKHFEHTKDGYPDIMVVEHGELRFEEIKAPGDVLRPNQLVSIQRLKESGFAVDITQVEWATNPDQVYSVVDIETTGGRKGGNAITEVAVVKVKNGEIIGDWSTLINPQRLIPKHITHLTGIDNNMVSQAPLFADIANELKQQLRGTIFVAHNVGFDYGFIKAAYEQIGQGFRMPKYCTVKNARKAFPGLPSYSLGKLTKELDIDLDNHHRALADATATAHLLRLIQDRKHSNLTAN